MIVRKRLNIDILGLAFVTTTAVDWRPIFSNDGIACLAIKQLAETINFFSGSVVAYCLMPSHLHAILRLESVKDLSSVMGGFKSLSSKRIRQGFPECFKNWPAADNAFHLWKPRFDDFIIRDMEQLKVKINYVHENPVRAKLVENAVDWKYSSAREWLLDEKGIIDIDKSVFSN